MSGRLQLTIILTLAMALPNTMFAFENSPTLSVKGFQTAPGTAPKRLALAVIMEIQDSLLTVKVNNIAHKILIDEKTKITRNSAPFQKSDIKTGMKVRISFVDHAGNKVATSIDIRSDAPQEAITPTPAAVPARPLSPASPPSPPLPGGRATRTIR